nr:reverse transcriptase domain-containing protein [Tanacetum cinerariifolium]
MADQRTMAQLLQAPTEGYEDTIFVLAITADNFELKHGLLTLVQNKQFFGHDKEDPHAYIRYFNNITSTLKFPNVSNTSIKLMLFPFSLKGAAQICLRNEITNFQQRFDESFSEAWDRFKDLLRACSYHGFSEIHQLDTFYNALNSKDQDSLNSAAGEITTRSGVYYDGPQIPPPPSSLPKVVENEPEATKDTVNPTNNGNTKDVQPQAFQSKSPVLIFKLVTSLISEPEIAPVSTSKPNPKASILYPSRKNDERNREKAYNQIEKFYQIFKDMIFEISFADALILMPKFASTLKALIGNKEKLSEMARTPLNEHCSAVLLKKLPKKLGDPGKFLIPCDFPSMAECLALADLDASINLMPFYVWKRLSLSNLTPTCMTLELADRSISRLVGVAKDVYIKVGSFYFSADFVVVDFDVDPRVPLILGRSFLKTRKALIDVFEGELTLLVGKKAITFNLDQTSRYSANYSDMTAK